MGKVVIVDLNSYFTQLLNHIEKSKLTVEYNGFKLCYDNQCMTFRLNDGVYDTIALGIGLCPNAIMRLQDIKIIKNVEFGTEECVFITNISTTADAVIFHTDFYYSDRYAFSERIVIVNRDLVVNEIYIWFPEYENGKIRYREEKADLKRPLAKLWLGVFATSSLA
ncbi:MAG: hypothetical protein QW212_06690 [Nitrososphaerales archaeon]